jgi:putative solute:sodium symporter small subunit
LSNTTLGLSAVRKKTRWLLTALLGLWVWVAFGWVWFARDLDAMFGNGSLSFWMAAQGCVLLFWLITVVNAWCLNRWELNRQDEAVAKTCPPPRS